MKKNPSSKLISWMVRENIESFYTSSVVIAELESGFALGYRHKSKKATIDLLVESYKEVIARENDLPFDDNCAKHYADIISKVPWADDPDQKKAHMADMMIAATARCHDLVLVSNDHIFEKIDGIELINPFEITNAKKLPGFERA